MPYCLKKTAKDQRALVSRNPFTVGEPIGTDRITERLAQVSTVSRSDVQAVPGNVLNELDNRGLQMRRLQRQGQTNLLLRQPLRTGQANLRRTGYIQRHPHTPWLGQLP